MSRKKIIYVGSRKIDRSQQTPLIMYRMLNCIRDRAIEIIELGEKSSLGQQLSAATYKHVPAPLQRLTRSRFYKTFTPMQNRIAEALAWRSLKNEEFTDAVILTVANGWGWKTAYRIAKRNHLPLQIVIHDDYAWQLFGGMSMSQTRERDFLKCLQYCETVYVVSESMREEYQRRYDVECRVLYPMMEEDLGACVRDRESNYRDCGHSIYHAGTLYEETITGLNLLASRLSSNSVKIRIVGASRSAFDRLETRDKRFEYFGFFTDPKDAMKILAEDARILILVQPRSNNSRVAHSFPSKFSDYCALGKPIICVADRDSAISKFLVTEGLGHFLFNFDYGGVAKKIDELLESESIYYDACVAFKEVGRRNFSENAIMSKFQV